MQNQKSELSSTHNEGNHLMKFMNDL